MSVCHQEVLSDLKKRLFDWQMVTSDPWLCAPGGVLEATGRFKKHPQYDNSDSTPHISASRKTDEFEDPFDVEVIDPNFVPPQPSYTISM
uniref:Uncharacterized protein n=1 Tax=Timema genevievae TaxID=629358 RepID=A0A7R9K3C8_TIMGE|nr:unnamed protein product [Timema genevievae]